MASRDDSSPSRRREEQKEQPLRPRKTRVITLAAASLREHETVLNGLNGRDRRLGTGERTDGHFTALHVAAEMGHKQVCRHRHSIFTSFKCLRPRLPPQAGTSSPSSKYDDIQSDNNDQSEVTTASWFMLTGDAKTDFHRDAYDADRARARAQVARANGRARLPEGSAWSRWRHMSRKDRAFERTQKKGKASRDRRKVARAVLLFGLPVQWRMACSQRAAKK